MNIEMPPTDFFYDGDNRRGGAGRARRVSEARDDVRPSPMGGTRRGEREIAGGDLVNGRKNRGQIVTRHLHSALHTTHPPARFHSNSLDLRRLGKNRTVGRILPGRGSGRNIP